LWKSGSDDELIVVIQDKKAKSMIPSLSYQIIYIL
jgi:hypothetical protein